METCHIAEHCRERDKGLTRLRESGYVDRPEVDCLIPASFKRTLFIL